MANLQALVQYCDQLLSANTFKDYCPNGLQVEGRAEVNKLITGVTASQALLDAAIAKKADAILVHHGYFWRGEPAEITGMKKKRLAALLTHDISLIGYHLPLDAHPSLGNNAQLAEVLGFEVTGPLEPHNKQSVGNVGMLPVAMTLDALSEQISTRLGRECSAISGGTHEIKKVAWCTGAAQSFIEMAVAAGADVYISGEISEPTVHAARELGIHYMAAGHHATERYGAKALGEHLADKFALNAEFVDIDNPV